MSTSTTQSTINFSVRKSSRTTNRVNYFEKDILSLKQDKLEISSPKRDKKTIGSQLKASQSERKATKTRARRLSAKSESELNENDEKLVPSPTKIKKTSDNPETNQFSKTKQLLSSSVVDSIVGRDMECQKIESLVASHLKTKEAVSLYISGSAGTGKTLSVTHVMKKLKETFNFQLININCMSFRNSNSIFNKILIEMKGKKCQKPSDCLQAINELLTETKSDRMVVLVLDEIDQLDTKTHDTLNTIFLWTKAPKSRLILIGIANALDLTARILSRIKAIHSPNIQEMHFLPYNTQQIILIIEDRIRKASDELNVAISPAALQLCARKIGSCSGDIRKALDVCRRALDLVEASNVANSFNSVRPLKPSYDDNIKLDSPKKTESKKCVDIPQIMAVLNRVYGHKMESVSKKFLPFNQQIILCSLLVCCKQKSLKEVKLSDCLKVFVSICGKRGISYNLKSDGEFLSMCELLEDYGFVSIKRMTKNIRNSKLSLRVNESEVEHSLSDTLFLNSILVQSNSFLP